MKTKSMRKNQKKNSLIKNEKYLLKEIVIMGISR